MLRENSPTGTDIEDLTGGLFDLACLKIIIIITESQSKIVEHPSINQNGRYITYLKTFALANLVDLDFPKTSSFKIY